MNDGEENWRGANRRDFILLALGGAIALAKDSVNQIIQFIADLGYTWNPNPTTIALVLIVLLGLKMIFLDGKPPDKPPDGSVSLPR